ncbi:unnamed protein product [Durusdinium trenchii]|uniref:Uncharacterized protein n=1 Tax=Durusdinium trenchii TaxID=1381693 RepID=A0ABP0QZS4_9DINO
MASLTMAALVAMAVLLPGKQMLALRRALAHGVSGSFSAQRPHLVDSMGDLSTIVVDELVKQLDLLKVQAQALIDSIKAARQRSPGTSTSFGFSFLETTFGSRR